MIAKGKLAAGLAGVVGGVAAVALMPASAGATCGLNSCGGGGTPGTVGLTKALVAIANTDCGGDPDCGGQVVAESVIVGRLALNHNETVLTFA